MRNWIIHHDESWTFTIAYVGLALVLSIWIGLFWLLVVVALHGVLELIRQKHHGRGLDAVLWEMKLDMALVLMALVLAAYMDVVVGAAGLGGAARLGAETTSKAVRATGWGSAIRGALLSVDDATQLARVALVRNDSTSDIVETTPTNKWSVGDHIAIWLGVGAVVLLVLSPELTGRPVNEVLRVLLIELHPFP